METTNKGFIFGTITIVIAIATIIASILTATPNLLCVRYLLRVSLLVFAILATIIGNTEYQNDKTNKNAKIGAIVGIITTVVVFFLSFTG